MLSHLMPFSTLTLLPLFSIANYLKLCSYLTTTTELEKPLNHITLTSRRRFEDQIRQHALSTSDHASVTDSNHGSLHSRLAPRCWSSGSPTQFFLSLGFYGVLFLEVSLRIASAIMLPSFWPLTLSYLLTVTTLDPFAAPAFPSPCLLELGIKDSCDFISSSPSS